MILSYLVFALSFFLFSMNYSSLILIPIPNSQLLTRRQSINRARVRRVCVSVNMATGLPSYLPALREQKYGTYDAIA